MKTFVSGLTKVLLLSAALLVSRANVSNDLPQSAFLLVGIAASIALWMARKPTPAPALAAILRSKGSRP